MENNEKKVGLTKAATNSRDLTLKIVFLGVLTALVVVLQLLSAVIKFGPFSITLALTPIIIGAALYGVWAGAWLGFSMGITVLLSGDAAAFLAVNVIGTILTVLVKGAAAGMAAGAVYGLIEKKSRLAAVICSSIAAPMANTGVFILGTFMFFLETVSTWAGEQPVIEFIFVGLIGLNFPIELIVNLALSTVVLTVINFVKKNTAKV